MGSRIAPGATLHSALRNLAAPLSPSLRRAGRWLLDPAHRRQLREDSRRRREFERRHARLLADPHPIPRPDRTLLVVSGGRSGLLVELALVKRLQLAGFRPVVVGTADGLVRHHYAAWGLREYVCWEDELPRPAPPAPGGIDSLEELLAFEVEGARVGKYAASSIMRRLRIGTPDPAATDEWRALLGELRHSIGHAYAARRILDRWRPDVVLMLEHGYTPGGQVFDLSVADGIDTLQWNGCHKSNALILKRYNRENAGMHPASLSAATWERVRAMPFGAPEVERFERELSETYRAGDWFGEVGTQTGRRVYERDAVRQRLELRPGRPVAVVFAHMFWDATFFYGRDLFRDYHEWFVETLRAAVGEDRVDWLVKIHPANLVKNIRDGFTGRLSEKVALERAIGSLPSHVRLIDADSDISTYSLFPVMDFAVTVRGTVGIEAASFGVRVLTAGTGRYDGLGFTIDSSSREEYLQRLRSLTELPPMTEAQRDLARRYAHAVFVQRPLELTSVKLEYAADAAATPRFEIVAGSLRELVEAADLSGFAAWARDGVREDYLGS